MRQESLYPLSFFDPAGLGSSARARILRSIRVNRGSSSASNSLWAECMIASECLTTGTTTFYAVSPVLLIGDAFLLAA